MTLWPGEAETFRGTYSGRPRRAAPVVSVFGRNVGMLDVPAAG